MTSNISKIIWRRRHRTFQQYCDEDLEFFKYLSQSFYINNLFVSCYLYRGRFSAKGYPYVGHTRLYTSGSFSAAYIPSIDSRTLGYILLAVFGHIYPGQSTAELFFVASMFNFWHVCTVSNTREDQTYRI